MAESLHIAFVASEMAPFVKTGGLADVIGALPKALAALGHRVTVFLPALRLHRRIRPGEFAGRDARARWTASRGSAGYFERVLGDARAGDLRRATRPFFDRPQSRTATAAATTATTGCASRSSPAPSSSSSAPAASGPTSSTPTTGRPGCCPST